MLNTPFGKGVVPAEVKMLRSNDVQSSKVVKKGEGHKLCFYVVVDAA